MFGKQKPWWHEITDDPDKQYLAELDVALRGAQQVGEDVAAQWSTWVADHQPCPTCGRQMGDHSRRELRRCDNARPDLQIVR